MSDATRSPSVIGLLLFGWIAGALLATSTPDRDPTSPAEGVHAGDATRVAAAVREAELGSVPGSRAGRRRAELPSRTLPARPRASLRPPPLRSALGHQLTRRFESEAERLTARVVRDLGEAR